MKPDVVVVGAGAAGIFAALRAAQEGQRVLLLEKTPRIGTKILVSGNGKCNIAHAGPIEEVLSAFRREEARFLRPSVYALPNNEIMRIFEDRGIELMTREDGRVFPVQHTAKDIVQVLRDMLHESGVTLCLETPVAEVLHEGGRVLGVRTADPLPRPGGKSTAPAWGARALLHDVLSSPGDGGRPLGAREILCDRVVLAVGGSSYPNSGTTGDGYPWVKALGHSLVKIRAALAPIYLETEPRPPAERAGLAVRGAVLKARSAGKEIARCQRDLLFTHQGVSGPSVLFISRAVAEAHEGGSVQLMIDFLPTSNSEEVVKRLAGWAVGAPRKPVASWLADMMPQALATEFLEEAGLSPDITFGLLTKKPRNILADRLKSWPLGAVRAIPLEKGECVAGGVPLDEIDPKTMRSLRCEGLWLCGEILDIAGPVGGYNLQSAFSTGWVAGAGR
jgi:predicted flavoprotein YhiN